MVADSLTGYDTSMLGPATWTVDADPTYSDGTKTLNFSAIEDLIGNAGTDVFDVSVKELIHDFTGGIARQINNLATACLLHASACNVVRVDETLFQQTTTEFHV